MSAPRLLPDDPFHPLRWQPKAEGSLTIAWHEASEEQRRSIFAALGFRQVGDGWITTSVDGPSAAPCEIRLTGVRLGAPSLGPDGSQLTLDLSAVEIEVIPAAAAAPADTSRSAADQGQS